MLNTKLTPSIYFELISHNPKLFIHSEFKTQITNLKFESKTKQRAGLESIRKMIDSEVIQIDIGKGSQTSQNRCKVGCAILMVISSDFHMGKHRDDDHDEDAPFFIWFKFKGVVLMGDLFDGPCNHKISPNLGFSTSDLISSRFISKYVTFERRCK